MINKSKIILLLVLCAGLLGSTALNVAAQTDKVLSSAQGKSLRQSDVNKLLSFYEWAFDTKFTDAERGRFQTLSISYFEQSPETASKDSDSLMKAYAQVIKNDAETQNKMRKAFNEGFVKDLRAATDDASRLLLSIYERGQEGEQIVETPPSEEAIRETKEMPAPSGGGNIPKNLIGEWFRSDGLGGMRDPSGKTRYNSGTDTTFEFFADGRMMVTIKKDVLSIMQCESHELSKLPGTFSVSGNRLTLNFATGSSVGTHSCEKSGNFKKSLSPSTMTKTFVVKELKSVFRPDAPMILCLDGSKDEDCFQMSSK